MMVQGYTLTVSQVRRFYVETEQANGYQAGAGTWTPFDLTEAPVRKAARGGLLRWREMDRPRTRPDIARN